ncbi:actin depolymerizing protein [Trichoderma longibrachiatum ATCC 18648]|uniref:Actin depolymerizing protein n=1 Tax=Trichoderma longibrachiatum ATCC 18648 TaxID=983965 RepID=A0A2T4C2A1_TRILO|nr:actin depolymerizing protein [Trichoderma longibrachiatum ATCC 18648]
MQSGISASEELQKAFSSLQATPSDFALLVTIQRESLVPVETLAGKSSDFGENLSVLEPFVKPDAALYAILRRNRRSPCMQCRAEQEAGSGTAIREIHLSQSLKMPVNEDAIAAMKEVAEGTKAAATLKINAATERVELAPESPNPSSLTELIKGISTVEPRFTFYRFTHTHNGEEQTPILFFYTCPATAGNKAIKNRMLYPLMKKAVLTIAEQEAGISPEKKFEVEDPSEITEQDVLNDLHPKPVTSSGFSRPKRPGR